MKFYRFETLSMKELKDTIKKRLTPCRNLSSNAYHCISFQNIIKESIKFSTFYISIRTSEKKRKERINPTEQKEFQYIVGVTIYGVYSTADGSAAEQYC